MIKVFGCYPEPKVGDDGLVFEDRPLSMSVLQAIPSEIGLWKTPVVYSSLEANSNYIVVGSQQGVVWVIDVETAKLLREFSVRTHKLIPFTQYMYTLAHGVYSIMMLHVYM